MKVFGISDLHLEFGVDVKTLISTWKPADFLVLAGDICNPLEYYEDYKNFLVEVKQKYKNVVFIAGNHEFYDCDYNRNEVIGLLKKLAEETDTHFLHNEKKVINGIEFIGCTLWSMIDSEATSAISDFSHEVFKTRLDYICEFVDHFRFLQRALEETTIFPRIVITHHLPDYNLIHKKYRGSKINSAFYSSILGDINIDKIQYWFCGHTHEYGKVRYGDMSIIVNPVGYPGEIRATEVNLTIHKVSI